MTRHDPRRVARLGPLAHFERTVTTLSWRRGVSARDHALHVRARRLLSRDDTMDVSSRHRALSRLLVRNGTAFALLLVIGCASACYRIVVPGDGTALEADGVAVSEVSVDALASGCSTLPEPPQPSLPGASEGDPACASACLAWGASLTSEVGGIAICWPAIGTPCVRASACQRDPFGMSCRCGRGPACGPGESCVYHGPLPENAECRCNRHESG